MVVARLECETLARSDPGSRLTKAMSDCDLLQTILLLCRLTLIDDDACTTGRTAALYGPS